MIVTTPERFREALTDEVINEVLFYINEPSPHPDPKKAGAQRCMNIGDAISDAIIQAFEKDELEAEPDDHGLTQKDFLMPEHAA